MRKFLLLILLILIWSGCVQEDTTTTISTSISTSTTTTILTTTSTTKSLPEEIRETSTTLPENPGLEMLKELLKKHGIDCTIKGQGDAAATSLVVDHENPNNLYVAIRRKGVFKTTDKGKTWKSINNGILAYPDKDNPEKLCYDWAGVMVMDPTDSNRVLLSPTDVNVGTINDPYTETCGIWETLDAGESWHQLVHGEMNAGGHGALAIDPNNPHTIYFSTGYYPATYSEADPDKYFNTVGVLHKTEDGGKSWEELPTGLLPSKKITDIDTFFAIKVFIDSENSDNLLILTNCHGHDLETYAEIEIDEQFGPMKSNDGGYTWTALADKLPANYGAIFEGDVAKNNFDHIFVNSFRLSENIPLDAMEKSFYSLDGGNTFKETDILIHVGRYDPHDKKGLHMIGFSPLRSDQIVESRDGGKTWKGIGKPAEVDGYILPVYDIIWDPVDPDTVYMVGGSANVWQSKNGGKTWKNILNLDKLQE